ncbi:helix-turn-helix domain-containing protein [Marinobacter sp. F4216]|uniref:helix-turn-helix domain-containing protein n=1 Tax=Marinobacter sp. F4216 TaxID=2874281 RepID=UPI001CBF4757|nr:helix-turn-helix transcriptional regulator [Marinobacter sp. F4216]MBZ2168780.1 helix-turn-helix transcriptional regulator [Marinobacter sp. F4216]
MSAFGTLFREMRQGKRLSQMDFALACEVSAKHISFLETGRSQPSKGMVLHLAQMLKTDLAGTNRLLSAAGYSQVYSHQDLSAPGMAMIREALEHLLKGHLPYPAVVFDHEYNLVMANEAMQALMLRMVQLGAQLPARPNFLLALLDEAGIKPFVGDWENIACHMLQRVYHEHLAGPFRDQPNRLLDQALTVPGVPQHWKNHVVEHLDYPAIPFTLNLGDQQLNIFSTIATIGTPLDVTAQNLRIEHFFPMDERSKAYWQG